MLGKEYETTLAKCSLFRGMSPAERQQLLSMLEPQSYAPGTSIFAEGESVQYIWIVLRGRCQVFKKSGAGEEAGLPRSLSITVPVCISAPTVAGNCWRVALREQC